MKIKRLVINNKFLSTLLVPILAFSGCAKSDCDMVEYHLHKYEKEGFVRYIDDEHLNVDGFNWTDEMVYVSESDRDLYKLEKREHLMKIDDNKNTLLEYAGQLDDYLEYEYKKNISIIKKLMIKILFIIQQLIIGLLMPIMKNLLVRLG